MMQKGFALVPVILLMILALIIGVGSSSDYVRKLRTFTETDSLSRAGAAADALLERLLLKSYDDLLDYVNYGNCSSDCTLQIIGADSLVATGSATLSLLGNSTDPIKVDLKTTESIEVSLAGYKSGEKVWICWNTTGLSILPSVIGTYLYQDKNSKEYLVKTYPINSVGSTHGDNGFSDAQADLGYSNCFSFEAAEIPLAVRLRSIYSNVTVYVIPSGTASLPSQGILITSEGAFSGIKKKVSATKSQAYMPLSFDYAIFSENDLTK